MCNKGWGQEDCAKSACWPKMCSQHGSCSAAGICSCIASWTGVDCDEPICQHGKAKNGTCVCKPGYAGDFCSGRACPNDCSGNGGCANGTCICSAGFTGEACLKKALPTHRPYNCGVHCVRKCLRVSEDDTRAYGVATGRESYNNCTKTCVDTCLKATPEEHAYKMKMEVEHPKALDIPAEWLPPTPISLSERR